MKETFVILASHTHQLIELITNTFFSNSMATHLFHYFENVNEKIICFLKLFLKFN